MATVRAPSTPCPVPALLKSSGTPAASVSRPINARRQTLTDRIETVYSILGVLRRRSSDWLERGIHNPKVPGSIPGAAIPEEPHWR